MRSLCTLIGVSVLVWACDGSPPAPEQPAESSVPAAAAAPATTEPAVVLPPLTGPVSLTAAGVQLDPPADKDQIPEGAWFCDMGTVHFAATDINDGKCPLCSMDLVHQASVASSGGY